MDEYNNNNNNNKSEIDDILNEFVIKDGSKGIEDTDMASLADKYNVDVSDIKLSASSPTKHTAPRRRSSSRRREDILKSNAERRRPIDRAVQSDAEKIDKDDLGVPLGHKVVYRNHQLDDNINSQSGAKQKNTSPVADENGVRVVFDADSADPTDAAAPFEDFGNAVTNRPSADWQKPTANRKQGKKNKSSKTNTGEMTDKNAEKKSDGPAMRVFRALTPQKGDGVGETIRKLIQTISIILLIVVLFPIGKRIYQKIILIDNPTFNTEIPTDEEGVTIDPRTKYPDIVFPDGLLDIFVDAYAANQDFTGWLRLQATNGAIDVPIVESKDNEDYVRVDFQGRNSAYGTPFLDCVSKPNEGKEFRENNVIHGHNMKDGTLFAVLEDFMEPSAFIENPVFSYYTKYAEHRFKIYAVIITNSKDSEDNGYRFYYPYPDFISEKHFNGYVKMLDQMKLYTTGVDIKYGDTLLSLSTCHDDVYETLRLVVVGRMLREGESEAIDNSKVIVNESPRFPQVWYDTKKIENPYVDAYRWMWNSED